MNKYTYVLRIFLLRYNLWQRYNDTKDDLSVDKVDICVIQNKKMLTKK